MMCSGFLWASKPTVGKPISESILSTGFTPGFMYGFMASVKFDIVIGFIHILYFNFGILGFFYAPKSLIWVCNNLKLSSFEC